MPPTADLNKSPTPKTHLAPRSPDEVGLGEEPAFSESSRGAGCGFESLHTFIHLSSQRRSGAVRFIIFPASRLRCGEVRGLKGTCWNSEFEPWRSGAGEVLLHCCTCCLVYTIAIVVVTENERLSNFIQEKVSVWPWAGHRTSLCLSFPLCEMGLGRHPRPQDAGRGRRIW